MANKYANLIGTNLIKDEYPKINTGFDAVETDIANHETAADPHDQYALDTDLATLQTEVDEHKAESMLLKEVHGLRIESGAWTPSLIFGSATTGITYSLQTGSYLRIGDLVFATLEFTLSSKGTSVGAAVISGLPYAATVGQSVSLSEIVSTNLPEGGVSFFAAIVGTQLYLRSVAAGGGFKIFKDTHFTNYSRFRTNFMYKI